MFNQSIQKQRRKRNDKDMFIVTTWNKGEKKLKQK